jgi:hypothetical protein
MQPALPARRRSPSWVRETASPALHSIVARFNRDRASADLTDAQEWLWDACISELEYRRRHCRPAWKACACQYCLPPFP